MEEVVEKMYNVLTANKQEEEKQTTPIKRKTEYTITTLNSIKKDNLKQVCMDYSTETGNLKKMT